MKEKNDAWHLRPPLPRNEDVIRQSLRSIVRQPKFRWCGLPVSDLSCLAECQTEAEAAPHDPTLVLPSIAALQSLQLQSASGRAVPRWYLQPASEHLQICNYVIDDIYVYVGE